MLKLYILFLLAAFVCFNNNIIAQELCGNGIDDDGDGLVDLKDTTDCFCTGINLNPSTPNSIIPNHSFEDRSCCPNSTSQLDCADTWIQASDATSDYFNTCGYTHISGGITPAPGIPDGDGMVGFYYNNGYKEYIGACLSSPMLAGVSYTIQFNIHTPYTTLFGPTNPSQDINITIFGTNNCNDIPFSGYDCPTNASGNFVQLGQTLVTTDVNVWQTYSITFTPTSDIYAMIIGPPCQDPTIHLTNYYYMDNLILTESANFSGNIPIFSQGTYCNENMVLYVDIDTSGGFYQWYKDSIAIIGANDSFYIVPPSLSGIGSYQLMYTLNGDCQLSSVYQVVKDSLIIDYALNHISCLGANDGEIIFLNQTSGKTYDYFLNSILVGNDTIQNISSGNYTIKISDQNGCKDSALVTILEGPSIDLNTDTLLCLSEGIHDIKGKASGGTSPYTYHWDNNTFIGAPYTINLQNQMSFNVYATDANGCMSETKNIQIYITPDIEIITSNTSDCGTLNSTYEFIINNNPLNLSSLNCSWNMGDGNIINSCDSFNYSHTNPGIYEVIIQVEFELECTRDTTIQVQVLEKPIANFMAQNECIGVTNHFTNTSNGDINTVLWNFSDLTQSTLENPSFTFPTEGNYWVNLSVTTLEGCFDDTTIFLSIYPKPVALFTSNKTCINEPGTQFTDGSFIPSGNIQNWSWTHNNTEFSNIQNPIFHFNQSGIIPVQLLVTSNMGCVDSVENDVLVYAKPYADFMLENEAFCIPNCIIPQDLSYSNNASIQSWSWSVTNNQQFVGNNPNICFEDSGIYFIQLIVADSNSCKDTVSKPVNAWPLPIANFSIGPSTEVNHTYNFSFHNESIDAENNFWSISDNSMYNTQHVYHTFNDTGMFEIVLAVQNKFGCYDTIIKTVKINPIEDIWLPNTFTPDDGNLLNQIFIPIGINILPNDYEFSIFNRWGYQVFKTTEPNIGWDGFYRGNLATQDIYTWKLQYRTKNQELLKNKTGFVLLLK